MPLRLRTLTLGQCLLPWAGDDGTSAAWLGLLADLSALESAHVHNCEVVINNIIECLDLYESDRSGLGWATFSPRLTPPPPPPPPPSPPPPAPPSPPPPPPPPSPLPLFFRFPLFLPPPPHRGGVR